jgi:hypothetical protein
LGRVVQTLEEREDVRVKDLWIIEVARHLLNDDAAVPALVAYSIG